MTRLALKKAGYRVTVANNGREMLSRVAEERPDVILLDIPPLTSMTTRPS